MRLGKIAVSVALGALAVGAQAQTVRQPYRTIAELGPCNTFKLVGISDGASAATCSVDGGSNDVLCMCADGAWIAIPTSSSSGTVSSVAVAVPSEWSVSGSPITTSGTITISEATQSANTVYAGPTTGGAAAPGFRSLVSADIPNNAANTSGNAGTATALAANGGNCSPGSYPLGVDASGAVESCTTVTADPTLAGDVDGLSSANDIDEAAVESELESVLDLQDLQGAVTDFQVPNNITVSLAATATALAANGANCSAGQYPLGVDASGAVENCTAAPTGTVGGSLGSTDNVVPRTSGTGGATLEGTGVSIDDNNRMTVGSGANGGLNFGANGARILDSNADGRLDFVGGGSSRMDLVDLGGSWRLRVLGASGLSAENVILDDSAVSINLDVTMSRKAAAVMKFDDAILLDPVASPPVTCDAGNEGTIYSDTSHALCWCDASAWQKLAGAGTCA